MSKSIYEELLEKIDLSFDAWDRAERFELFELIEHALEQAQNQEKLLELYRELITLYHDADYFNTEMEAIEIDLEQQIKELENESN